MTADQFVKALRAEGVKVTEYPGWRTHSRNHKGAWGPVNGVVIHHTAGADSLDFVYRGSVSLPGPLCHTHLAKSGVATMIGNGRANHAGTFAANAFNAMLAESATHPRPDASEPIDANSRTYGIEIENRGNGSDPYPAAQYDAAVRWAAAICRFHGWSANSVIGHKEGTRRKIDPSFDMNKFRADVAKRLAGNTSDDKEDDPMAGYSKSDIGDAVLYRDNIPAPKAAPDRATNTHWTLSSYAQTILNTLDALRAEVYELRKEVRKG